MDRRSRTDRTSPNDETARIRRTFGKIQKLLIELRQLADLFEGASASPLEVARLANWILEHVTTRLPKPEVDFFFRGDECPSGLIESMKTSLREIECDARSDALSGRLHLAKAFGSTIPDYVRAISLFARQAATHPVIMEWMPTLLAEMESGPIEWTEYGDCLTNSNSAKKRKRKRGRPPRPTEKTQSAMRLLDEGKTQEEVAAKLGYASRTTISKIKKSHSSDSVK